MVKRTLTMVESAVYDLVRSGALETSDPAQYRPTTATLEREGLIRRSTRGGWSDAAPGLDIPRAAPPPEPMRNFVIRIPDKMIAALDALGPSRSEAARILLARGLGWPEPPPRDRFGNPLAAPEPSTPGRAKRRPGRPRKR